jgi:hypothetical protein
MSGLIPLNNLAGSYLQQYQDPSENNSAFSDGISVGGGPTLSKKGKVWRLKDGDQETPLLDQAGNAIASISVILLDAMRAMPKSYYASAWKEGDDNPPDCESENGVAPTGGDKKQHTDCASCPMNQYRSAADGKSKACTDKKVIAVCLYNEGSGLFRGPDGEVLVLKLDITPGSFKHYKKHVGFIQANKVPVNAVVTSLAFEIDKSHPVVMFNHVGVVDEATYTEIQAITAGPAVQEITHVPSAPIQTTQPAAPVQPVVQPVQPVVQEVVQPAVQPVVQPVQPVVQQVVEPAPTETTVEAGPISPEGTAGDVQELMSGLDWD